LTALFINAAEVVLGEIGFPNIRLNMEALVEEEPSEESEILIMVGLVGHIKGHLVLHFPPKSAVAFVGHLSDLLGMDGFNPDDMQYRKSALAEIANQIGGKATVLLSELGVDCLITPPTVLSGKGITTALPEADERHFFSIFGDFGNFTCILAVKNSKVI
jgi:CheY-specific phosphatase CheX